MVHGYGAPPKKILKKTLIKHCAKGCFEDFREGEFFNGAFKKNLLILHEHPAQKNAFPVITG